MLGSVPITPANSSSNNLSSVLNALSQKNWLLSKEQARKLAKSKLNEFSVYATAALKARNISLDTPISFLGHQDGSATLSKPHPEQKNILEWFHLDEQAPLLFKDLEMLFESIRQQYYAVCENCNIPCFHLALTIGGPVAFFECLKEKR